MKTKTCTKCGEVKALDEFHKFKHSKDGLKPCCKPCNTFLSNKFASEHKEESTRTKMDWYKRQPESYQKNREHKSNIRRDELLPDSYVATCVARQDFSASDVPAELITIKREQIQIHRLTKQLNQALKDAQK